MFRLSQPAIWHDTPALGLRTCEEEGWTRSCAATGDDALPEVHMTG